MSNETFKKVKGVIFDLDGLLLDTEPLYQIANEKVCQSYGKDYPLEVKVQVIGKAERLGAEAIARHLGLSINPHELLDQRDVHLEDLFPTAKPMPGALRLCQHLHKHNIPIAVATSSNSVAVGLKLNAHKEWFSLFGYDPRTWTTTDPASKVISGDNPLIKLAKPSPDIFLLAASRIHLEPADCLVFEDSVSGLQAGKAAGMSVVSVPDPVIFDHNPDGYKPADLIINSLEDFKPELFGLPPFE